MIHVFHLTKMKEYLINQKTYIQQIIVPLYRIYIKEASPVLARHPDIRAMITVCAHFKFIITNFLMVTIYST